MENVIFINHLYLLFFIKHFIVDFLLQTKYQYSNKHIFASLGGILHAELHGFATLVILLFYFSQYFYICVILGAFDFIFHYFIDFLKSNINIIFNLKADNSEKFWWLLGIDQLFHYITYYYIINICIFNLI